MFGVLAESQNLNLLNTNQSYAVALVSYCGDFTVKKAGLGEGPYTHILVIIETCTAIFYT